MSPDFLSVPDLYPDWPIIFSCFYQPKHLMYKFDVSPPAFWITASVKAACYNGVNFILVATSTSFGDCMMLCGMKATLPLLTCLCFFLGYVLVKIPAIWSTLSSVPSESEFLLSITVADYSAISTCDFSSLHFSRILRYSDLCLICYNLFWIWSWSPKLATWSVFMDCKNWISSEFFMFNSVQTDHIENVLECSWTFGDFPQFSVQCLFSHALLSDIPVTFALS